MNNYYSSKMIKKRLEILDEYPNFITWEKTSELAKQDLGEIYANIAFFGTTLRESSLDASNTKLIDILNHSKSYQWWFLYCSDMCKK